MRQIIEAVLVQSEPLRRGTQGDQFNLAPFNKSLVLGLCYAFCRTTSFFASSPGLEPQKVQGPIETPKTLTSQLVCSFQRKEKKILNAQGPTPLELSFRSVYQGQPLRQHQA